MSDFKNMEEHLIEAGKIAEKARQEKRSLGGLERAFIREAKLNAVSFGLSGGIIQTYLKEGEEKARMRVWA